MARAQERGIPVGGDWSVKALSMVGSPSSRMAW
jgi:hypothetical protein